MKTILPACLILALSIATTPAAEKDLATFRAPDSTDSWISVNDGVMGGVSEGRFERTSSGNLLFKGKLSLENNGGFASIRSKPDPVNLRDFSSLAVKAKGDGRTYWIELRVARQPGATSYRANLPTTAGQWQETIIPLKDFKLQAFGQVLPAPAIDLAKVDSVGFTLADKKAGPFELEIESVKAIGDTPTEATPASPAKESTKQSAKKANDSIVAVASKNGAFKTLLAAATAAGLADTLDAKGPFTVFAPTDEAFAKLPPETVKDLLQPSNREKLQAILKYHVLSGRVSLPQALEAREATTLQGAKLPVRFDDGRVKIGPATLRQADIQASNGVIHVIDQVLLPPVTDRKPLSPVALIESAIELGVPLYNNGNPAACAAVYEIACEGLRAHPEVAASTRKDLSAALDAMRQKQDPEAKAWILREALDRTYLRLTRKDS